MTIKQYAELLEYIFKNNGWNVETFYENSAKKIIYMLKGYQNDGYVSYWY